MDKEKKHNDHIQLHQGWMRNFKNGIKQGDQVYCLNVGNNVIRDDKTSINQYEIKSVKIRYLGARMNYYVKDFEKYLGEYWETHFGEWVKVIITELRKGQKRITITKEQTDFIKRFMALSIGRSDFMKREIIKQARNLVDLYGINEITPLAIVDSKTKMFEDCNVQFIRNSTTKGFVLPSYTYYYASDGKAVFPVVALNDKYAIKFVKKEIQDSDGIVFEVDEPKEIEKYNKWAVFTELKTNSNFIIAKNKEDLELLLED